MKIGILALLLCRVASLEVQTNEPLNEGLIPEIETESQNIARQTGPTKFDISTQESLIILKKTISNPSYITYTSNQEFIPENSHEHPKRIAFSTILNNANQGHIESIKLTADILLFGMYEIHPNNIEAFSWYQKLSDLSDSYGQYMVGQLYATGMGVNRNYQKALIYTTFAASKGNLMAHHTLGYWFHSGIGVSQSCQKALFHYQKIAESNYKTFVNGKPGGTTLPPVHKMLGNGLYGKGASGSGNPLLSLAKEPTVQEADLLLLYKLQAEAGDAGSQFMLGQYYYSGTSTLEVDFEKAHLYFQLAAKQYPTKATKDQNTQETIVNRNTAKAASESAGYLGKMYWRGEGVKEDHEIARKWFERGASQDNPASTTYLAKMYLEGVGGLEKSKEKYEYYLNLASNLGHAYGKVLLGELLMEKNWPKILALMEDASKRGYVLGNYHLGKLYYDISLDKSLNCKKALSVININKYTKMFVERAYFHDQDLLQAKSDKKRNLNYSLFMRYLMAAERGYMNMQLNSAYMLDIKSIPLHNQESSTFNRYQQALALYLRSANQGHVDSRVRVGDIYFYGLGLEKRDTQPLSGIPKLSKMIAEYMYPNEILNPDYETAIKHYSAAAEGEYTQSSIAMYNLGFSYEHGLGVKLDYNLSKRWYDMALSTNPGAYLPIQISTFYLHLKWIIDDFVNGVLFRKKYSVDVKTEEFPVPGEFAVEEINSSSGYLVMACFALGALVYWRTRLLARIPPPVAVNPVGSQRPPLAERNEIVVNEVVIDERVPLLQNEPILEDIGYTVSQETGSVSFIDSSEKELQDEQSVGQTNFNEGQKVEDEEYNGGSENVQVDGS